MPNTTTIAVTTFSDDEGIEVFISASGMELQQIVCDDNVDRGYVVCLELWALTVLSMSGDEIRKVINIFRETTFLHPENACLIVSCDDNEHLEGCYPRLAKA